MIEHSAPKKISKPQIKKCLEKEDWGQEMLKKVSLDTVVNRIKYEKHLRRASKKWGKARLLEDTLSVTSP